MAPNRFVLAFILGLLPAIGMAASTSLQDAAQLFQQGRSSQALDTINDYLAANAKDPQGRFLKGLILADMNRSQEAIKVFSALTDDYPALPEPYNNLAVLYAAEGRYEQAKDWLERAIRIDPGYATAHENLGDIYAEMAYAAYGKALELDKSDTSAKKKLALIKEMLKPSAVAKPASLGPAKAVPAR